MTVATETYGYDDKCCLSHEFLRRGCTKTPMAIRWAGDLLVYENLMLKQSEVNDMRGGDCETVINYEKENENCPDAETGIPIQYRVEETPIRTGDRNTFNYTVQKNEDEGSESNWTLDIYQSTDDCGKMMDGGDALQDYYMLCGVTSLCGTVDRSSGAFAPQAHYLDNRKSYSDDPDNGLLVCIRTGAVWNWEIRYAPVDRDLTNGLIESDDVSEAFTTALSALGLTHSDVFEFGMI